MAMRDAGLCHALAISKGRQRPRILATGILMVLEVGAESGFLESFYYVRQTKTYLYGRSYLAPSTGSAKMQSYVAHCDRSHRSPGMFPYTPRTRGRPRLAVTSPHHNCVRPLHNATTILGDYESRLPSGVPPSPE